MIFSCVLQCFVSRSLYRYPRVQKVQRRDNFNLSLLRREIVVNYRMFASTSVNILGSSSRLAWPNSMRRNHLEWILNIVSFLNEKSTNWFRSVSRQFVLLTASIKSKLRHLPHPTGKPRGRQNWTRSVRFQINFFLFCAKVVTAIDKYLDGMEEFKRRDITVS